MSTTRLPEAGLTTHSTPRAWVKEGIYEWSGTIISIGYTHCDIHSLTHSLTFLLTRSLIHTHPLTSLVFILVSGTKSPLKSIDLFGVVLGRHLSGFYSNLTVDLILSSVRYWADQMVSDISLGSSHAQGRGSAPLSMGGGDYIS